MRKTQTLWKQRMDLFWKDMLFSNSMQTISFLQTKLLYNYGMSQSNLVRQMGGWIFYVNNINTYYIT